MHLLAHRLIVFIHLIFQLTLNLLPAFEQTQEFLNNTIHKTVNFVPEKMVFDIFICIPAYELHSLHRGGSHHMYTDCTSHNAIPANPGRCRTSHSARCSCPAQPHPSKKSTNRPLRILNSCNHPLDPLEELFHSRRAVRIFLVIHQAQDPCTPQHSESYRWKEPQHQHR